MQPFFGFVLSFILFLAVDYVTYPTALVQATPLMLLSLFSFGHRIGPVIRRELDAMNAAAEVNDLRQPPGNRLEALQGDMKGHFSIRVNDQYRITLRFDAGHADDVSCQDYH